MGKSLVSCFFLRHSVYQFTVALAVTQPALLILFSPPNRAYPSAVNLKLNETNLQQVNSCQYLRIIVYDELKQKPHINIVTQKLKKLIGICYKVRYRLPEWCLPNIQFAFVYPYITCGLEIYGNTCVTYLNKLIILNNKIHHILQRKSPRCCTTCFHAQYNTIPPAQLFDYHVVNLVYKMIYSPFVLPSTFQQYLILSSSIHQYSTRHNKLSIPQPISHFGRRFSQI